MLLRWAALRGQFARISTLAALCNLVLLVAATSCRAWGVTGHTYINNLAVDCTQSPLTPFYEANRTWIAKHSIDPDEWRRANFAMESPRHFIDLDAGGDEAARSYPEDYWVAVGIFGKQTVDQNGTLPWRVAEYYGKLVRAFRAKDPRAIVEISTWLGHYVADAHVPFHATANYDGQLTGQKGIHARFEVALLEQLIKPEDLKPMAPRPIKDVVTATFQWVRSSLGYCPDLLAADKRALLVDAGYGYNYYAEFALTARPIAMHQLEQSARDVASLWMSAWIEAGRPELAAVDGHAGAQVDRPTHDPDLPASKPADANVKPANP